RAFRLAGFLRFDFLVYQIVHGAPVGATAVVLDQRATDGLRHLDHLGLDERRGAEGRAPRDLVGQPTEEGEDGVHLGNRRDRVPGIARETHVVADALVQLNVIGRAADLSPEIAKVLDEQVARAVLPYLQLVA